MLVFIAFTVSDRPVIGHTQPIQGRTYTCTGVRLSGEPSVTSIPMATRPKVKVKETSFSAVGFEHAFRLFVYGPPDAKEVLMFAAFMSPHTAPHGACRT